MSAFDMPLIKKTLPASGEGSSLDRLCRAVTAALLFSGKVAKPCSALLDQLVHKRPIPNGRFRMQMLLS